MKWPADLVTLTLWSWSHLKWPADLVKLTLIMKPYEMASRSGHTYFDHEAKWNGQQGADRKHDQGQLPALDKTDDETWQELRDGTNQHPTLVPYPVTNPLQVTGQRVEHINIHFLLKGILWNTWASAQCYTTESGTRMSQAETGIHRHLLHVTFTPCHPEESGTHRHPLHVTGRQWNT